jgi:RND family efflux transporter MFP subunit
LKFPVFAIAATFLAIAGCPAPPEVTEPAPRSVEVFQVDAAAPASEPVYAGTLRAKQRSDLSFLQTGQIREMSKDLGERFQRGEVLARLDSTELALAVEERMANLVAARAELADARLGRDRLVALEGSGATSRSALDSAVARFDSAKARTTAIEASLGQARKRLAESELIAPFDGQVVERLMQPSQAAAAGQTVYRVIGEEGGLEAVVNLPVMALDQFAIGSETQLLVRPTDVVRRATVIEVGNAAGRSGLYPISLALEDTSGLRSGLRVEVPGRGGRAQGEHPTIPLTAYRPASGTNALVFLVDPDTGRITTRDVELGTVTDEGVEVVAGLARGDLIVARGLTTLRSGETVVPLGIGVQRFNE